MCALEKVAWMELIVSATAVIVVSILYPWMGDGATGAFGLLGFLGFGGLFLWQRGSRPLIDERDRAIDLTARLRGIGAAWMFLFGALIVMVQYSVFLSHKAEVSITVLNWLIWTQFAVCYGVKGFVGVMAYRRQRLAS